jgi:hypothetical protein
MQMVIPNPASIVQGELTDWETSDGRTDPSIALQPRAA